MRSNPTLTALLMALSLGAQAREIPYALWERCRAMPNVDARLTCYDDLGASPAPAAAKSSALATASAGPAEVSRFGASQRTAEPMEITSQTAADFAGWSKGSRIRLANGQLWVVTDSSNADLRPGVRPVRIERTVFGDYRLVVQGLNTAPKVQRLE